MWRQTKASQIFRLKRYQAVKVITSFVIFLHIESLLVIAIVNEYLGSLYLRYCQHRSFLHIHSSQLVGDCHLIRMSFSHLHSIIIAVRRQ